MRICRITKLLLALTLLATAPHLRADPPVKKKETPALPVGVITPEMWQLASTKALTPGEIDQLIDKELAKQGITPAPLTTDEQFVRRVFLDLTGQTPLPADVTDFLRDSDPDKRAKLIDTLLDSEEFGKHWARYWRNVVTSRLSDPLLSRVLNRHFELWMGEQLMANRGWGDIVKDLLTASGDVRFTEPTKNGAAAFLAMRRGADAVTERAAEVSRIFLGIQIQCAQCHDHPSDVWKRQQFHEFAAYFSRLREKPLFENMRIVGQALIAQPFGQYQMPGKNDPKKTSVVLPRFLDGQAPADAFKLTDLKRREALATAITSQNNPWFAAAYVNRLWGELMGQSFYQPIDDMGPNKEAVFPPVLARVAGSFRGSDYDTKALFRAILNSKTYQRQIRPGESADDHLLFAAKYPARLNGDALWQALVNALGKMGPPPPPGGKPPPMGFGAFNQSLERIFKEEFNFDPSTRAEEVEGSIAQALMLMNNPTINAKIRAQGPNLLARILTTYPNDNQALDMLYLRVLSRRPTERERRHCAQHLKTVGDRAEAFEDILWALINSTEFQTRR